MYTCILSAENSGDGENKLTLMLSGGHVFELDKKKSRVYRNDFMFDTKIKIVQREFNDGKCLMF